MKSLVIKVELQRFINGAQRKPGTGFIPGVVFRNNVVGILFQLPNSVRQESRHLPTLFRTW